MFFFIEEVGLLENSFVAGNLNMIPLVYEKRGIVSNFTTDFNFFVLTIAKFMKTYNLGNANDFILNFKVDGQKEAGEYEKNSKKNFKNCLLLTSFFEDYWKLIFVNGATAKFRYRNFSLSAIYKNERTATQFSAIMFKEDALDKLLESDEISKELKEVSKTNGAVQVAFTESVKLKNGINCRDWWKENRNEHDKKFMFLSDELKV